jgi:hypothetical protein
MAPTKSKTAKNIRKQKRIRLAEEDDLVEEDEVEVSVILPARVCVVFSCVGCWLLLVVSWMNLNCD